MRQVIGVLTWRDVATNHLWCVLLMNDLLLCCPSMFFFSLFEVNNLLFSFTRLFYFWVRVYGSSIAYSQLAIWIDPKNMTRFPQHVYRIPFPSYIIFYVWESICISLNIIGLELFGCKFLHTFPLVKLRCRN